MKHLNNKMLPGILLLLHTRSEELEKEKGLAIPPSGMPHLPTAFGAELAVHLSSMILTIRLPLDNTRAVFLR